MSRPSSASSNGSQSRTSSASSDDSFFSVADGLEQLELDTSDIFDDNVYAEALLKVEIPKNANEYYSIVKKEIEYTSAANQSWESGSQIIIGGFRGELDDVKIWKSEL